MPLKFDLNVRSLRQSRHIADLRIYLGQRCRHHRIRQLSHQCVCPLFLKGGTNANPVARAGLRALEFYSPEVSRRVPNQWPSFERVHRLASMVKVRLTTRSRSGSSSLRTAHMQARIGITLWLILDGIVELHIERDATNAITNAFVTVDRKALAEGRHKDSMGRLLVELQVRRSIGDAKGATEFIKKLTTPPEEWKGELRDYVLANRSPRKVFVQPNAFVRDGMSVLLRIEPGIELEQGRSS